MSPTPFLSSSVDCFSNFRADDPEEDQRSGDSQSEDLNSLGYSRYTMASNSLSQLTLVFVHPCLLSQLIRNVIRFNSVILNSDVYERASPCDSDSRTIVLVICLITILVMLILLPWSRSHLLFLPAILHLLNETSRVTFRVFGCAIFVVVSTPNSMK